MGGHRPPSPPLLLALPSFRCMLTHSSSLYLFSLKDGATTTTTTPRRRTMNACCTSDRLSLSLSTHKTSHS